MEITIEIAHVAHARDTTPEKRSPDHLAMTGAPVQQRVVQFERRPNGSGGRTRTYDQSVNSRSETQQIQVVEDPAGDLRAIGPESPESLAERLLQRIAADADVPRELLRSIGATMASDAEQVLARGPHALDRAATWALGVLHRTESARRLANKGSA